MGTGSIVSISMTLSHICIILSSQNSFQPEPISYTGPIKQTDPKSRSPMVF
ncbi:MULTISPECIES: hypothetical protein [Methanobacterium]|uniref:hypothetical protein n=1 Tax=Methanobacterium TaxID=2160 RepID=UPI0012FDE4D5|nr:MULTISPECIES: hypothetical protein [Methanobacterium]MBW4258383.1 hypothetical protein [Methanobacterium sp. YSL]MCC7558874.1 hypothetical protein [Methanobacterium sp.]